MKRGPKPKVKPPSIGNRCEVKAWFPAQHLVEIAQERTQGMVDFYYLSRVRGNKDFELLPTLLRSAYMQGVNDTIYATVNNPLFTIQPTEEGNKDGDRESDTRRTETGA